MFGSFPHHARSRIALPTIEHESPSDVSERHRYRNSQYDLFNSTVSDISDINE